MTQEETFDAGGVQLSVDHRSFGDDGGPAVRVFADVDGESMQVLRFDCFRNDPHYHFDPTGRDDKLDLSRDEVPDPIAWTLQQLGGNLRELIRTAGHEAAAEVVDQDAVATDLGDVEAAMRTGR